MSLGADGPERIDAPTAPGTGDLSELATLHTLAARAAGQSSGENFPVALRVLPSGPRDHLQRLYSYARFVDDVGDEAPGDRLHLLDLVAADVARLGGQQAGAPVLPPVAAMAPVLESCGAPLQTLLDLVEANRVDQLRTSYETFEDLLGYCELSAAPVGRMVLYVAGAATSANISDSDDVCAALQVLEHCQDVGEDARAGRVYLPDSELRAAGVSRENLLVDTTSAPVRAVVSRQVMRARDLLQSGRPLVRRLRGWARIAVAGYLAGGLATADALDAAGYDVLGRAVRPPTARTGLRALQVVTRR